MKLYYAPAACSLAAHIVAREAGVGLDLVRTSTKDKTTESGADYLAINPKGAVPALEMNDGQVLTENAVIMQYLAAQAPGANLVPADGDARWRQLELVNFVATELHKGFSPLFNPATPADYRPLVVEAINKKIAFLEGVLGGKTYLTGDTFTIADAYAYTILNWTRFTGIDLSPYPKIQAFMERVAARPAVQHAMREEGLLKAA